jgi:hypothetical protein
MLGLVTYCRLPVLTLSTTLIKMPKWYAEIGWKTREERATIRSKTFPGIADAMANQWGHYVIKKITNCC